MSDGTTIGVRTGGSVEAVTVEGNITIDNPEGLIEFTGHTASRDTLNILRNRILLTQGFLCPRVAAMDSGTREAYQGPVATEEGTPVYWFDSSDNAWYDAATGWN